MRIIAHDFAPKDFVGGHVVLDFVNTVTARDAEVPVDWLDSYTRLLDWAELSGAIAETPMMQRLHGEASISARRGANALAYAKRLREDLYVVFSGMIKSSTPLPEDALTAVEAAWKKAVSCTRLEAHGGRIDSVLDADRSGLDVVAHTMALKAADLFRELPNLKARVCLGPNCGWLFVDRSKAGRRVWCDMATCGNDAKSRRHVARRRL